MNALRGEGRAELVSLLLAMLAVAIVAVFAVMDMLDKPSVLISDEGVLPGNGSITHSFSPCIGESSPGVELHIVVEATKPLHIVLRNATGGVVLEAKGFLGGELVYWYRESLPCAPLLVVVEGPPGTHYKLSLLAKTSGPVLGVKE